MHKQFEDIGEVACCPLRIESGWSEIAHVACWLMFQANQSDIDTCLAERCLLCDFAVKSFRGESDRSEGRSWSVKLVGNKAPLC